LKNSPASVRLSTVPEEEIIVNEKEPTPFEKFEALAKTIVPEQARQPEQ
jgi:hypothetical protein